MSSPIAWMRHHQRAGLVRLLIVGVAVVATSSTVIGRSQSAFTATTGNSANQLSAGNVALTDNDGGSALYSATGLVPGSTQTGCIQVTYGGTLTPGAAIKLYGSYVDSPDAGATADSTLAPYLDTTIQLGTAGSTCAAFTIASTIYTGTLSNFTTTYSSYATGLSTTWTPAASSNEMRAFKINMTVQDTNSAMGQTAEPAFTWEVRSS